MQQSLPFVAFTYNSHIWDFIEKKWNLPKYSDYGAWDIMVNELYDFMY